MKKQVSNSRESNLLVTNGRCPYCIKVLYKIKTGLKVQEPYLLNFDRFRRKIIHASLLIGKNGPSVPKLFLEGKYLGGYGELSAISEIIEMYKFTESKYSKKQSRDAGSVSLQFQAGRGSDLEERSFEELARVVVRLNFRELGGQKEAKEKIPEAGNEADELLRLFRVNAELFLNSMEIIHQRHFREASVVLLISRQLCVAQDVLVR